MSREGVGLESALEWKVGAYPFQGGLIAHLDVLVLVIPIYESEVED